jgi:spermidine synthase
MFFQSNSGGMGGGFMTEVSEKKGRMKLTVEVEVNEELMDVAKEAISKMSRNSPNDATGNQEND